MDNQSTWIITDGAVGNLKQCLALCRYLRVSPHTITSAARAPGSWFAPRGVWLGGYLLERTLRDALADHPPRLLITAGRQSALLSRVIGKLLAGGVKRVHILNPRIDPALFDLVITPAHDDLSGANVLHTVGSLNVIDEDTLAQATAKWAKRLAHLPSPRHVLLIGGSNRAYEITDQTIERLARTTRQRMEKHGGSLLVSLAPRSGKAVRAATKRHLQPFAADMWQSEADNPYLGYLAYADFITVTPDSVNMVSEACAVGVPVAVDYLPVKRARFRRFFDCLAELGHITAFADLREHERAQSPLRETQPLALRVGERLGLAMNEGN